MTPHWSFTFISRCRHQIVTLHIQDEYMRRFPSIPRKKSRIEIIPMIDVMMFLLVFFVLLSINVIPALGLKVKLPVSSQVQETHPPVKVQVGIPAQGHYLLDGETISDLALLTTQLRQRREASSNGIAVVIHGDENAPLQRLVEVMDVLKSNGIDAMTISAKRK
jgi:biopolymer transport protein ExbD